jgi:hypothetical protein
MTVEAQGSPARGSVAKPAMSDHPVRRHKRSNNLFAGILQNSHHGRRIIDLSREYLQQLGNPTSLTQQAAVFAAVQLLVTVLASMPPTMDQLDQLVRVEAAAGRALKRLGLDKPPQRKSAEHVTLEDIEREHASREAAE